MPGDENSVSSQPGLFPVQPPPSFDFDKTSGWPAWMQNFDDYRFASGLNERTEEAQVRTLLYTMGQQALKFLQTFNLSEEGAEKYALVKKKFDDHFIAARNLVYESACFHRRYQEPGGDGRPVRHSAAHVGGPVRLYGEVKERMARDRFVVGLRDGKLSETLQMDVTLTVANALANGIRLKEGVTAAEGASLQFCRILGDRIIKRRCERCLPRGANCGAPTVELSARWTERQERCQMFGL